jgi:anti-sigma factor RsiW
MSDRMKPSTSSCDDVLEMLPLHVGGDLEAASLHAVARHIERCPACRAAEARVAAARDALRAGLELEVRGGGPALWPALRAELRRADVLARRSPWRVAPRFALALAAAAAVLALVVPRLPREGGGHVVDLVENGSAANDVRVDDPRIAELDPRPTASPEGSSAGTPNTGGLVPIHDVADLLQARPQLGPGSDPVLKLTSSVSPVR